MLGPLAALAVLRVLGVPIEAAPGAREIGQWVIGASRGLCFSPQVVRDVAGWGPLLVAGALCAIAGGYGGGALAWLSALPAVTLVLGLAPGGIAKMCITAMVLPLGVPLVTAFHVTRVVVLLLLTAALFGFVQRVRRARRDR